MPLNTQAQLLCAWNAFVLQTLGDQFLEADARLEPATAGFVPPVTADQVMDFYSQVEGWVSRANQARSNSAYRLDVQVPADLTTWTKVEPCPKAHLEGTLAAAQAARVHAEAALTVFLAASHASSPTGESMRHLDGADRR